MVYRQRVFTSHDRGKKKFKELDETVKSIVRLGDDKQLKIEGRGTVFVTPGKQAKHIKDVHFAPNLAHNLLSVGQLMESGHSILFDDGKCMLLKKKEMVTNPPSIISSDKVCESCVLGKQTKQVFPVGKAKRANEILELVHADLCGPMRTESLGGSKYFLLFIDDYSRMSWIYFLQQKSETFDHFKRFKALTEKQSWKSLKVLRYDRGGEFLLNEFVSFCEEHGIKRELTAPYSPEQNGVAKRKNRIDEEHTQEEEEEEEEEEEIESISTLNNSQQSTPKKSSSTFSSQESSPNKALESTQLRKSKRGRIPRKRFECEGESTSQLALFVEDPASVDEALKCDEWRQAMVEKLEAIERN
ncbi:retrovirus-related pol polyprotein from transposon TNT 1-94 [Tanacetum coccineum]